uniref:Myotubularin phosphatase domain-containing protein n=1 Tax=Meloidogyne incognita TaxID=6306 RepID=A0A914MLM1_MELIC
MITMQHKNRFSYNQAVNYSSIEISGLTENSKDIVDNHNGQYIVIGKDVHKSSLSEKRGSELHESSRGPYTFRDLESLPPRRHAITWLLPGEELHLELNVIYHKQQDKREELCMGYLYVTDYRLRFEERIPEWMSSEPLIFDVVLGCISKIEKIGYYNVRGGSKNSNLKIQPYGISINCKDVRKVRFFLKRELRNRRALFDCLKFYSFPNTNRQPFFAKKYKEKFQFDGWLLFDANSEFIRQKKSNDSWRPTLINKDYDFAGTYPSLLFVPSEVFKTKSPDDFLSSVSKFRSKKRIPVLSWIDYRTSAALVRSSQPLVGALSRKSASDEDYLDMIVSVNPNSKYLLILDARPSINAKANRANGGGYENYSNCQLKFMDIQNIHVVRESLKKLKDACFPRIRQKRFQQTLEETKWLAHLQTILDAAALAAREIYLHKNSVLVHCSDGWDRTAQITSLTMLQLDPYYRTIEGFSVLIEKEWCSFGHKFAHRIGHGQDKPEDKERSPIFVQFIDCVWQLYNQFTSAFEFNVRFLKTILDELYSCRFGTFLYNCERERSELQVKENTTSVWSFILENRESYVNDKYDSEATLGDFIRQKAKVYPRFWTDYYCRYSQLVPKEDEDRYSLFDHDGSADAMTILNGEITRFKVIDSGSSESEGLNEQNESIEIPKFRLSPAISPTFSQQFSYMPHERGVQSSRWSPARILQQHGTYSFVDVKERLPNKYYNLPSSSTLSDCKNETKF